MSSVEQVTVEALIQFVNAIKRKEGALPPPSVYMVLLDECLADIFRETKAFDTNWTNATDGDLDLDSSNVTNLPIACLSVRRVEWDGSDNPLERQSLEEMDYQNPGWRDQMGTTPTAFIPTGRRLFLNITPSDATGKLVVRGPGVPPRNDALAYLPIDVQLAPAKYILKQLPWDPEKPLEVARYQQYTAEWVVERGRVLAALRDRSLEEFEF